MTETGALAELEDLAEVMTSGGYRCSIDSFAGFSRVLLAQSPYALVAGLEVESWDGLAERVSDLQAELTRLTSATDQTWMRWDLYVLVHVRSLALKSVEGAVLERIESDTKFARKFVRVNLLRNEVTLDQALRPLLPLRQPVTLNVGNPLDLLTAELEKQGIDRAFINQVIHDFKSTGEVVVQ